MENRLHKGFINKYVRPTIDTPDFLSIAGIASSVTTYNRQYYGDALMEIHEKYRFCAWLPDVIFKLGYIQALTDTKQRVEFNMAYSDSGTVKKAYKLLVGNSSMDGGEPQ